MDSRERILEAAMELIQEKGEQVETISVREICKRADVGLGLVNYYFGSKEKLMEECVERLINGIVARFRGIREETKEASPFEKLRFLGNMTFEFLFTHAAVSRISVLTDMQSPKAGDNTHRTHESYLPLVAACRPDWDEDTVKRKTLCLITIMQQAFLRREIVSQMLGIDLGKPETRRAFHEQILHDILEG